jgi:IS30 family transposase
MAIPTPEVRLAILFVSVFAISLFIAIVIIMHSLGNMANHLRRMESIISKEIKLRYNQQVNFYKQQKQRSLAQKERESRQAALLDIPLVRTVDQKMKERL